MVYLSLSIVKDIKLEYAIILFVLYFLFNKTIEGVEGVEEDVVYSDDYFNENSQIVIENCNQIDGTEIRNECIGDITQQVKQCKTMENQEDKFTCLNNINIDKYLRQDKPNRFVKDIRGMFNIGNARLNQKKNCLSNTNIIAIKTNTNKIMSEIEKYIRDNKLNDEFLVRDDKEHYFNLLNNVEIIDSIENLVNILKDLKYNEVICIFPEIKNELKKANVCENSGKLINYIKDNRLSLIASRYPSIVLKIISWINMIIGNRLETCGLKSDYQQTSQNIFNPIKNTLCPANLGDLTDRECPAHPVQTSNYRLYEQILSGFIILFAILSFFLKSKIPIALIILVSLVLSSMKILV